MRKISAFTWIVLCGVVNAQNLTITNARIIDGNGGVIPRGSIVVRDGRIASVSQGAVESRGGAGPKIDAKGMTVMPGFIDDHRHIIAGSFPGPNPDQWMKQEAVPRMQEFLDAGFTTIQSCGDPVDQIVELQKRLNAGGIKGPHVYTAAFVQLSRPPGGRGGPLTVDPARIDTSRPPHRPTQAALTIPENEVRADVRKLKEAGIDDVKTVISVTPGGPEARTLAIVVDEAKKAGMPVITHAVTVEDMFAAIGAGVSSLAHTPHIGQLDEAGARKAAASGIPMMSTLGVFAPTFAEDNERIRTRTGVDNIPRFRDLDPFPFDTLSSAGQGPVNARMLWEAGMVYGYGTDTTFLPKDSLVQELKALRLVFSRKDMVQIMTRNAAAVIGRSKEIGTLEAGKQADIVMLDGDPLENIDNVLKVRMVVKSGSVVVDHRPGNK